MKESKPLIVMIHMAGEFFCSLCDLELESKESEHVQQVEDETEAARRMQKEVHVLKSVDYNLSHDIYTAMFIT